jgi:hypothetical protein
MATFATVLTEAGTLERDITAYRTRNSAWYDSIVAQVDAIIATLRDCDAALGRAEAAASRGEPPDANDYDQIVRILKRAQVAVDSASRPGQADQLIARLRKRLEKLKKPLTYDADRSRDAVDNPPTQNFDAPDKPTRDLNGRLQGRAGVPPSAGVPPLGAAGSSGGWRPTPKISRRVSARKKSKNKSATKFISKSRSKTASKTRSR